MALHSVVYVLGTALQGVGVLLIIPFATRVLGAAEFGRVATGLVAVQMVGTLAAAGLPQVILREQHRGSEGPRVSRALAGAMVLVALGVGVLGAVVVAVVAATGRGALGQMLPVVVAAVALTVVVSGQTLMRARMKPLGFFVLAVGSTVLAQLGGLLAARAQPTATTYLTAYAGVLAAVAAVAVVVGRPLPPTAEPARVRAGARLAAPLLPQAAAMLGLLMGDVVLTSTLLGASAAGGYQVALQLANTAFVLSTALFNAWGPLVLSHPIDRRWSFTSRTGAVLIGLVVAGGAGVAVLGPWLVSLMTRSDFDRAAMVPTLGWLTAVAAAYMLYQGSSLAVLDAERTGHLAWGAILALGVLVVGTLVLAPPLGIVGIAVAKVAAYLVLAGTTAWLAARHSELRWSPLAYAAVATSVVLGACTGLLGTSGIGAWLRIGVAVAIVVAVLAATPAALRVVRR
jgi:O-antigen/teichoic acid export membrane protein